MSDCISSDEEYTALCSATFSRRERTISAGREAGNPERWGIRLASCVIVCVLGLQFAAVVVRPKEQGWPFTNYPMFAAARHEGDRVMVGYNVFASLGNGREIKLAAEDIDIPDWLFRKWAAHLVRQAKQPRGPVPQSARIRARLREWLRPPERDWDAISGAILARYQKLTEAPITALRIEDTPVIVTRAGMADAAPQVLTTVVVDSDDVIQGTLPSHHLEGSR